MKRLFQFCLTFLFFSIPVRCQSGKPGHFIFKPDPVKHGHTHASSIIELPDGSLLACWYEGKTDRSKDVHLQAARLLPGKEKWSPDFLLADTPGLSDNNPCLFLDAQQRLWLFYYTLLGSPEAAWHTAFLRYKISTDYQNAAKPIVWNIQQDLPVKPVNLDSTVEQLCQVIISQSDSAPAVLKTCAQARQNLKDQLARKLGWTTRARPLTLSNGSILLPMASEIFGIAAMAITKDAGKTWTFSRSPLGYGVEQPTVLERKDKSLLALMRDSSPAKRIRQTESFDMGCSWTPVTNTQLPNPGSGLEILRLQSGNVLLIYNDCEDSPRNSLAVSLSDDEGKTWKWTRHLEQTRGDGRFDYPSIIQARDGKLHATYSFHTKTIKHVIFSEDWIYEFSESPGHNSLSR